MVVMFTGSLRPYFYDKEKNLVLSFNKQHKRLFLTHRRVDELRTVDYFRIKNESTGILIPLGSLIVSSEVSDVALDEINPDFKEKILEVRELINLINSRTRHKVRFF